MQNDITQTTQTDMTSVVTDYSVDTAITDGAGEQKETEFSYPDYSKWLGYYKKEMIKKPIDNFATWVLGLGYTCELSRDQVILDNITGWGEDGFLDVLWNLLVIKKVNGDSFAHIIRNKEIGTLINLKPLPIEAMKTIVGADGIIIRYEQMSKVKGKTPRKYEPNEILHLVNDRIADECRGVSVIEVCEWAILAMKETLTDWKRISHRTTIRVLYVDINDKTRLANLKSDYAEAMKTGELLILPVDRKDASFEDLTLPPVEAFFTAIRYYESLIYKAVGFPKSLTGDAEGIPESGGKMAYQNHMPIYNREVTTLEADFWNQVGIKINFNRQESLTDSLQNQESKNNAQTGFQPSDTQIK